MDRHRANGGVLIAHGRWLGAAALVAILSGPLVAQRAMSPPPADNGPIHSRISRLPTVAPQGPGEFDFPPRTPMGAIGIGDIWVDGSPYVMPGVDLSGEILPPHVPPDFEWELLEFRPPAYSRARSGPWQGARFDATWLAPGGGAGLGMWDLGLAATIGLPLITRESPLLIEPSFGVHYWDGPATKDAPPRFYDAALGLSTYRPLTKRWSTLIGVTPGVYTDFKHNSSQIIRISGRGIVIFQWTENVQVLLGAIYLDRDDVGVLPVAGLTWLPNDDEKFELLMPRPRYTRRVGFNQDSDFWVYVAGELGGGSWFVERASGAADSLSYRDIRVLFGVERKAGTGWGEKIEMGYVFARDVQYRSEQVNFEPDDTVLLRVGIAR